MGEVITIGLDIAKNVFQAHGADSAGRQLFSRRLARAKVLEFFASQPRCLVALEACGGSHHWARELMAMGHEVVLIPPAYIKPYVKRGKNDAVDAAAICEAMARPDMRFVPVKSADDQAVLMLHKSRELLIKQRTMSVNALRGHLAEFGLIEAQGPSHVRRLLAGMRTDLTVPELARETLDLLATALEAVDAQIDAVEAKITTWHKANPTSQRLATIPGIGPLIASAITATVADPAAYRSGREFAAWLGLTPRQKSTGGKQRLGRITRKGDQYLRRLLIIGAQTVLLRSKAAKANLWIQGLLARCARLKVAVALANKTARIAWAVMIRGECYRPVAAA